MVFMLDDVQIVRERLGRFVFTVEIGQGSARGTKDIIETILEGLA